MASVALVKRQTQRIIGVAVASAVAVVILFPIVLLFGSSLKPIENVFDLSLLPQTISLDGYRYAFEIEMHRFFFNSLFVSATVTVVALFFHSMAAYPLARMQFTGRKAVFVWILSTLMIPFPVIMIPLFIVVRSFGWLNSYQGVIIPAIPHAYGIFLFRQFYMSLPKELEEAAAIDGCSPFATYWRIFIPLSKPIGITLAVGFFIANWNNYLWPLIVNNERRLWVLQVAIANFISRSDTRWDAVLASGVVSVLPTILFFFLLQRYLIDGIKMEGLK